MDRSPHLLATTDGSERSLRILSHAARLARAVDLPVRLIRVLDPLVDCADVVVPSLDTAIADVTRRWEQHLNEAIAAAGIAASVEIPVRRQGEDVAGTIRRVAAETGALAIAIDSRGTGAIRHALLGSVALETIGKTSLPVLTSAGTLQAPGDRDPYHLLATSDGSPASAALFRAIAPLLGRGGIRVTLFRVAEPNEDPAVARRALDALAATLPPGIDVQTAVTPRAKWARVSTAIVETATDLGVDAIAAATHGHSARYHLFAGSNALQVLAESPLPVLLANSRG